MFEWKSRELFRAKMVSHFKARSPKLISVNNNTDQQALYLEQILREAYAHPAVEGIVLWAARTAQGCYRMCLTDENYNNNLNGAVVDKLIEEWKPKSSEGKLDSNGGVFKTSLFHGDYDVTIDHPSMISTLYRRFEVTAPETSTQNSEDTISPMVLHVQVDVR